MPDAELEAWLRLGLIPRLGPVAFRKLLSSFGSPEAALNASTTTLANVVGADLAAAIAAGPDANVLAASLHWADEDNNRLMTLQTTTIPSDFSKLPTRPRCST